MPPNTPTTAKPTLSPTILASSSLNPIDFAPFGEVIENPATHSDHGETKLERVEANQGSAIKWMDVTRLENWYTLAPSRKAARSVVNMFVCKPRRLEEREGRKVFQVKVLERHPFTPQTFVPLGVSREDKDTRYMVIVAPTLKSTQRDRDDRLQPYPAEKPKSARSLKDRLLGARPNPFTNDHEPTTTPSPADLDRATRPKGPGEPDLQNMRAFIARGDQAVTYGPGTWHAPMVVLGKKDIDFVVVQYANGVAIEDCQEVDVREDIAVDVKDGSAEQGASFEAEQALVAHNSYGLKEGEGKSSEEASKPGYMRAKL
ncbi:Ureidoglycolate lyase [Fulvia fulva]|nr:Ureidoglycolate lyase [Fulvia fulva]KAK4612692.1 Ureidoglycolate lyase [Fulvia fulva]WPV36485.1 Ureidoglycolate lyase [Fulvia fulva]